MCVPDADLHGKDLRRGVILQELGQVAQRGHQEVCMVSMETQLQEAVSLRQRRVGSGAGPVLQPSPHLRTVQPPDGCRADLTTSCEEETEALLLIVA